MEQPKSNENPQSADDAMNRLHNLASEHPDPEKDEIAKKLLEQWEKAREEGNSDEVIRLIGEIETLYDGTPKESEKTPDGHVEVPKTEELSPKASRELKENGTVVVGPLKGTFDPKEFFNVMNWKTRLISRDGFESEVLAKSKKVSSVPESAVSSFDLVKPMNDTEIRANLPDNHVFSVDDLWMIADIIENKSDALCTISGNLFYMQADASVCVVKMFWCGPGWSLDAQKADDRVWWGSKFRVFSRNG
jgi:hypothetical protein